MPATVSIIHGATCRVGRLETWNLANGLMRNSHERRSVGRIGMTKNRVPAACRRESNAVLLRKFARRLQDARRLSAGVSRCAAT